MSHRHNMQSYMPAPRECTKYEGMVKKNQRGVSE